MLDEFIAHCRSCDQQVQSVCDHLVEVSDICEKLAGKIEMADAGRLLGLLHDVGKYGSQFQSYIRSATDMLDPDIDGEYVDANSLKGKIDHSTAGAQWIWQRFNRYGDQGCIVGQIMAVCLASHHGGLIDCLKPDGKNGFLKRIKKEDRKTHLQKCLEVMDQNILNKLDALENESFLKIFCKKLIQIIDHSKKDSNALQQFRIGFFTRFLFSCLIDADRINSADFETPENKPFRNRASVDWSIAIARLEKELATFPKCNPIDDIRCSISTQCKERAKGPQGIYTLTVPTGGGKTLASIRYALHHAREHGLDHIIYIIPFTSIIEQNAKVIRDILEKSNDDFPWILEHHSNLDPELQTWPSKLVVENWDAPIVFTTMVQFLESLFGGGTRGARRMHNIAKSVLIFDEIQNLPINCVHLFCNAIQFFTEHTKTTAILCTATQPLLDKLEFPDKGQLRLPDNHELVQNVTDIFDQLKRVEVKSKVRPEGWSETEISELAFNQLKEKGNCLVIVNTKAWAQTLYECCQDQVDGEIVFHLSTSLCPAHRKEILNVIRQRLDDKLPVLCISTQLIEAGVDIDFNSVIRFLAGLDSIAQAAGRCNRNGNLPMAQVFVVNPKEETIEMLPDIKIGRDKALRILSEKEGGELLTPEIMHLYFSYYFYERSKIMDYPLTEKQAGRKDTLLSLLGDNHRNTGRTQQFQLRQSFKTAARAFKAIDAPTQAVIVPYGSGKEIIAELSAAFEPAKAYLLLKQAQQYSVNVFPHVWQRLVKANAVMPVQKGVEIYFLDEQYYSKDFGLSTEIVSSLELQMF